MDKLLKKQSGILIEKVHLTATYLMTPMRNSLRDITTVENTKMFISPNFLIIMLAPKADTTPETIVIVVNAPEHYSYLNYLKYLYLIFPVRDLSWLSFDSPIMLLDAPRLFCINIGP